MGDPVDGNPIPEAYADARVLPSMRVRAGGIHLSCPADIVRPLVPGLFPRSPLVEIEVKRHSGHDFGLHRIAGAYHRRVTRFAAECRTGWLLHSS